MTRMILPVRQVVAPGVKSAVSDCILLQLSVTCLGRLLCLAGPLCVCVFIHDNFRMKSFDLDIWHGD